METPKIPTPEKKEEILHRSDWAKIPRKMLIETPTGEITEQEYGESKKRKVYALNNSVYAIVDEAGNMFAAPATPEKTKALKRASYEKSSIGVPFSNGELPIYPKMRRQWEIMQAEAEILRKIQELKEKKEIEKTLPDGDWLEIPLGEKIEFEMIGGGKSDVFNLMPKEEQLETYNKNGGVLSFYDKAGNLHFAPATINCLFALKKAGYKYNMNIAVPFSNGETPVDPTMKKQWEIMLKDRDEEREKGITWEEDDTERGKAFHELYG